MTTQEPLVSIIMPSYNHEEFVQEAIQSVIDQDYGNIELIIIDDGSSDRSPDIIASLESICVSRFSHFLFIKQRNHGLAFTLNKALDFCSGEYLIFIASDDKMMPYRVGSQVKSLLCCDDFCVGLFSSAIYIDGGNNIVGKLSAKTGDFNFHEIFYHRHNLPACTQMLKINKVRAVGGFPVGYVIEDWYLWLSMTVNGDYFRVESGENAYYRVHSDNTSSDTNLMHSERLKVLDLFENKVSGSNYRLGKACCFLATSIESKNKFHKIKMILLAVCISPFIFLERKLYVALIRLFK